MKRILLLLTLLLSVGMQGMAQREVEPAKETDTNLIKAALKGWHVRLGAGFNIGGTSPIPLPAEIRQINAYHPMLNIELEGLVHRKYGKHWGSMLGIRLENKAMKTDARVKNYHLVAYNTDGSGKIEGAYWGNVKTKVNNNYLTFPILATYSFNDRWQVQAGPYFSYLINGNFTGSAYSQSDDDVSYIRQPNPAGPATEVTSADYDFSKDLRRFAWGLQVGGEFKAYKHLSVSLNLTWGLNSIFPSDYESVTFALYPIYGTLGFNYLF
uniref:porin family protein n=1 Tax=Alloprevotella sp. TaxID=1872471 RepID=UPI004025D801